MCKSTVLHLGLSTFDLLMLSTLHQRCHRLPDRWRRDAPAPSSRSCAQGTTFGGLLSRKSSHTPSASQVLFSYSLLFRSQSSASYVRCNPRTPPRCAANTNALPPSRTSSVFLEQSERGWAHEESDDIRYAVCRSGERVARRTMSTVWLTDGVCALQCVGNVRFFILRRL